MDGVAKAWQWMRGERYGDAPRRRTIVPDWTYIELNCRSCLCNGIRTIDLGKETLMLVTESQSDAWRQIARRFPNHWNQSREWFTQTKLLRFLEAAAINYVMIINPQRLWSVHQIMASQCTASGWSTKLRVSSRWNVGILSANRPFWFNSRFHVLKSFKQTTKSVRDHSRCKLNFYDVKRQKTWHASRTQPHGWWQQVACHIPSYQHYCAVNVERFRCRWSTWMSDFTSLCLEQVLASSRSGLHVMNFDDICNQWTGTTTKQQTKQ